MSKTNLPIGVDPVAESIPFDNETNGFTADNVQEAIEEARISSGGASPGFSFGRNGVVFTGSWLRRPGNVLSNRAGVTVDIGSPVITRVAVSNRNIDSFIVQIFEHEGDSINLTFLGQVLINNARGGIFSVNFPVTQGRQLAVRLFSGFFTTVRDIGVDIILEGVA